MAGMDVSSVQFNSTLTSLARETMLRTSRMVMWLDTAISLVVHIAYTVTSVWYVIYQTLSPFLRRRGWHARLHLDNAGGGLYKHCHR